MDKYRGINRLPLVDAKVNHLLGRLGTNRSLGSYATQESLVRAYADICKKILDGFDSRVYDLPRASRGAPVSEQDINAYLLGVYSEVQYILAAVKGSADAAEENFNFGVARVRDLQSKLKYCRQQLSTFALYATQFGNSLHFGETFSNENNIDRGSDLLGQEECFIDLAEGTVTLPLLDESDTWSIKSIQLGALSNAVLGNNVQASVPVRGSISALYDGNVDTWTEFERIVEREDSIGLKLELKVILGDTYPVNALRIHPVFLGARTPFSILDIEVSSDGRKWISLRNEVRVADFLDEDPEQRFHLSPHSSKFAGEVSISFAPRMVKFIRLLIHQSSAFPISDVNGVTRLRYAVGIKEIEVYGHKYSSTGELISKPIDFSRSIAALGINSLVDPPGGTGDVGGVEYFISYDDGASWNEIVPLDSDNLDVPEVLYPPESTSSVRYKLHLWKDELKFEEIKEDATIRKMTERFSWSERRPFDLALLHKPVEGSISVCDPEAATRGKVYPRTQIGSGVESTLVEDVGGGTWKRLGNTELRVPIPLKSIKDPTTFYLYVNNTPWTKVGSASDISDQWERKYVLERSSDSDYWEAVFGNGSATTPLGRIPGPGDKISIFITEENTVAEGFAAPYKMKLDYTSDGVKGNTRIRFHGGTFRTPPETMPTGVTSFRLSHKNVLVNQQWDGLTREVSVAVRSVDGSTVVRTGSNASASGVDPFDEFKSFVDGESELSVAGDWTVDSKEGIIYLHKDSPTLPGYEYAIYYVWEDAEDLAQEDWDFVEGKLDEIQIYDSGYKTKTATYSLSSDLGASAGDKSVAITDSDDVAVRGVVKKSLRIQGGELGGYKAYEIPFIDGKSEFSGRAKIQDEEVPENVSGADSIASFRLTHWQTLVPSASLFFTDEDTFETEKASYAAVTSVGDYYFDYNGAGGPSGKGYVYVHMGGVGVQIPSDINVAYQYYDEFSTERTKGAYSIDPVGGILYLAESLVAADLSKEISFKYTPYRARYNISVQLEEEKDYEVDLDNKLIRILADASGAKQNLISVNYEYEPDSAAAGDLAPYFSPLVRAIDVEVS